MSTLSDMRQALNLAGNTRDADRWTAEEWLKLRAAYSASHWDKTPDEWSERQIREALRNRRPLVPCWAYSNDGMRIEERPGQMFCDVSLVLP